MVMVRISRFSSWIIVMVSRISLVLIICKSHSFLHSNAVHGVKNILMHNVD